MPSRLLRLSLFMAPVVLAACDGEPSRVSGIVPYVMERTAGTGVAYVRAKMMPEKSLVVAPAETKVEAPVAAGPPTPPPTPPEEQLKDMEPVFKEKQKK